MAKYTKFKKQAEAILKEAGITNVEVRIENHYNGDYDRTDYYICGYYESWDQELRCHTSLIDKWFEGVGIFSMFFTQRADWLKATTEVKKHCWDNNIHPAEYKAPEVVKEVKKRWKKGDPKDYSAKVEYWDQKTKEAITIGEKEHALNRYEYFYNKQQELC
jgi:hypothetical protein